MKKFYFCESLSETYSFTLDYFIKEMIDRNINELVITEAVRDIGGDYFFCKAVGEVGEKSEGGCGNECDLYEPRNGTSGCCKKWRHCRTDGDDYVLTIDGKLSKIENKK